MGQRWGSGGDRRDRAAALTRRFLPFLCRHQRGQVIHRPGFSTWFRVLGPGSEACKLLLEAWRQLWPSALPLTITRPLWLSPSSVINKSRGKSPPVLLPCSTSLGTRTVSCISFAPLSSPRTASLPVGLPTFGLGGADSSRVMGVRWLTASQSSEALPAGRSPSRCPHTSLGRVSHEPPPRACHPKGSPAISGDPSSRLASHSIRMYWF